MTSFNLISPANGKKLNSTSKGLSDGENTFEYISDNIPNLIYPFKLSKFDRNVKDFYEGRAEAYEKYLNLTFKTYNENEIEVREKMVDLLNLSPESKVLEVACGTGRDSVLIDRRLNEKGELHLTDISLDMIMIAKEKLDKSNSIISYSLSNAMHLPYPDNYFDAFYSFGALGEFSDPKMFFKEVARVCKTGSKIVVGDENLPVWQRNTTFGRILSNYNNQFLAEVPFESLPVESRNVKCQWIIGGVFYLIDFNLGEGEPKGNFDFEIPGHRGGTHLTRYYGQLEGVTVETKKMAIKAIEKSGSSMHSWLDYIVKKEAKKILDP